MRRALAFFSCALVAAAILHFTDWASGPIRVVLYAAIVVSMVLAAHELAGKPVPFLRWSFLRMGFARKRLFSEWQVGDGREEAAARHVLATVAEGDLDGAISAIDHYAYTEKFLISLGDEKGAILDEVMRRLAPARVLELGTYIGYSALRMARLLPASGHVYSIEWSAANAQIAHRIVAHAGVANRVTIIQGSLGDQGQTMAELAERYGFREGSLDLVFIDHDKNAYVPDLETVLQAGWLHGGSVIVADNVLLPGAPEYRAFIDAGEGTRWTTRVHATHAEYQSVLRDIVLESTLIT